jgi:hypothetical protein
LADKQIYLSAHRERINRKDIPFQVLFLALEFLASDEVAKVEGEVHEKMTWLPSKELAKSLAKSTDRARLL